MWSDGCDAQFKLLASFHRDLQLKWNYNEAHHGKGSMNGVGGTKLS